MKQGPNDLVLYLYRHTKKKTYTMGRVFVNGERYCDCIEDRDRGLNQTLPLETNKKLKVYGETAIPMGTYELDTVIWAKYGYRVVHLKNVPAYTDILIHNGSTEKDTLGCLVVGDNKVVGRVTGGKKYMAELAEMVDRARRKGGRCTITIADTPIKKEETRPMTAGIDIHKCNLK